MIVLVLIVLLSGCIGVEDITSVNNSTSDSTATTTPKLIPTFTNTPTPTLTAAMTPTVTPTSTVTPTPQITVVPTVSPITTPIADQKTFTNSIGIEFILIPAGEFDMGSPPNEKYREAHEGPVHHVILTNAFYMGKYEVTQKQWRDVMGNNPSYFKDDARPVEQVSWNDAQEFIKKLNEKEGTDKYRLPSEAEWEYAARAGTTTMYSFGDDESMLGDYAWYEKNSGERTHPVGQKKPNPWGLYDMHGSLWEWVQDRTPGTRYWTVIDKNGKDEYVQDGAPATYDGAPADGSAWESKDNMDLRVERGGNWRRDVKDLRSATRFWDHPDGRFKGLGFRIVKDL